MSAAAIYARYSSDLQREASIEDQTRICRERAAKEGWSIYQEYTDSGISGASLIRPGILAMATKAKTPLDESDVPMKVTKMVAGARNHLNLLFDPRSCCRMPCRAGLRFWSRKPSTGCPATRRISPISMRR